MTRPPPSRDDLLEPPLPGEPGPTPGQAEGPRDPDEAEAEPIGRTAGQAEGDRETIEENLRRLEAEEAPARNV